MSNERNTKAQVFIAALAIIVIIGGAFSNARGIPSLHNKNDSVYTPLVGLRVGINNAPTSNGIHHQYFISARHLYSTPTFNSDLGSKKVADNIPPESSSNKVVMINFDDGRKSQLIYAKPILDKYGFKASFFLICGRVGTQPSWMNWQDIAELKKDGMDIESHTMTHANLNKLSANALNYEIGGSKQCFAKHGYNTTIFGYPFNLGSDKPTVVNLVAKYYNMGRSGTDRLMFLNCIGFMKDTQTDCRTYSINGKLTHANRYDVRSASFYHISNKHNFSPPEMFQIFLQIVNSQTRYNSNGKINAVPILVYHNITNSIRDYTIPSHASSTTLDLFAQEMKYLHDNGFRVLLLNQVGYDSRKHIFYIKSAT
ncbi:MAG: polysaccharide deacetylase family protein [Candidatus Nitrosopolaris sp.]